MVTGRAPADGNGLLDKVWLQMVYRKKSLIGYGTTSCNKSIRWDGKVWHEFTLCSFSKIRTSVQMLIFNLWIENGFHLHLNQNWYTTSVVQIICLTYWFAGETRQPCLFLNTVTHRIYGNFIFLWRHPVHNFGISICAYVGF